MKMLLIRNFRFITNGVMLLLFLPIILLYATAKISSDFAITIFIIAGFSYYGVVSFIKKLFMRNTLNLLFQECDPYRFLEEAQAFVSGEKNKNMKLNFLNWELIGLINTNRIKDALEIQKLMESRIDDKLPPSLKAALLVSFSGICIVNHQISQAEMWMKRAEELLKTKSFKPHEVKRILRAVSIDRCNIDISLGKSEGCEERLKGIIEFETRKFGIIGARYLLGKLYLHQKRFDEAKTELEFVIANGNRLLEVEKAKSIINQAG